MNTTGNTAAPALDAHQKACGECGAAISKKAEICPKCGVRQKGGVSKVVLVLLTFFLGGIGAHKFYLRKPVQGVFYLLFCWTMIPGLIALVEFIIYLCTPEERLNEKYESSETAAIVAVACAFGGIFLLGILAAIAIPAYQDYTVIAKATDVHRQFAPQRAQIADFAEKRGKLPAYSGDVIGSAPIVFKRGKVVAGNNGVLVLELTDATIPKHLVGNTIEYVPGLQGTRVVWDCSGGSLPRKYHPRECRGGHQ